MEPAPFHQETREALPLPLEGSPWMPTPFH